MSESKKYRKFTAQQKTEIVLASLRGNRSMAELCREHEIADSLLRKWREQFLAAGAERLSGKSERTETDELRARVSKLERALGRKTMESKSRGNSCGDGSEHARRPFGRTRRARPPRRAGCPCGRDQPSGDLPPPKRPPKGERRPLDVVDRVVLDVARENPTDGTRMVAALASRELTTGTVNRKRAQRLMREHRLLQPKRSEGRRRRPGYFEVTRPDELWHLDMTSVWVAEHGWCYLNAAIDCCTREITGWAIDIRCRAQEATAVIDHAISQRAVATDELTLGTDNGTAYTSRSFRARLAAQGIAHRRGGYRDPESQAFIESWFSKLKLRCVWREEFETLDEARTKIGHYIDRYHHRPHSSLNYKTPREVAAIWKDHDNHLTPAA